MDWNLNDAYTYMQVHSILNRELLCAHFHVISLTQNNNVIRKGTWFTRWLGFSS